MFDNIEAIYFSLFSLLRGMEPEGGVRGSPGWSWVGEYFGFGYFGDDFCCPPANRALTIKAGLDLPRGLSN